MKRKVVFRADGNFDIGYGHFIRTLGIAGLINKEFECIYATQIPTDYQLKEINKVCGKVIELSKSDSHFTEFIDHLEHGDIVVLDNYFFSSEYQSEIRNRGCKVIYIDDYNDKYYVCDALINNIPGFNPDSFVTSDYTKLYLGTDYALLRKEFFNPELRKIRKEKNTIFVSFGGGDVFNISEKILDFLMKINPAFKINLLIGDAYKFHDNLKRFKSLTTYKNISAGEVALLIAAADICIVPASSLLNEAASIGSKILLGYFTDNQIQPYEYFVSNDLALGVGDYRMVDLELFENKINQLGHADFLIDNQKKIYHYQQADNLKKIFYAVSGN
jgi:UDP-2,4-diacetamido-2,4,6-trideoxy-beta-L-altropyranose hydrolase